MTDAEVGIYGFERPRPSGNDCSLSAPALTKQRADGQNPGSGEGREGNPKFATKDPFPLSNDHKKDHFPFFL